MKSRNFLIFVLFIIFSSLQLSAQQITAETALKSYINNGDTSYKWEIKDAYYANGVTRYNVLLTSQTWREFVWKHQLTVFVPDEIKYDGALFFITGGSVKDGEPNWNSNDGYWPRFEMISKENNAVTAMIRQVPNQPIIGKMTEDELISYTLHNFKADNDYSWPLLFPMVKSAIRGLDAVQEIVKEKRGLDITRFITSGASKRGWTTWLTSAIDDPRVEAIGPMVIDMLNMPATLDYQYKTYGDYSVQIQDYTKLGIVQDLDSKSGLELRQMIDPYSYRNKMTVPKLLFIGTNDEYWTLDAMKFYWNDIPGKNMIHVVPNAGHNLGGGAQAFDALNGFFAYTLQRKAYPVVDWSTTSSSLGTQIKIDAPKEGFEGASLWFTTSSDKDFRNNFWNDSRVRNTDGETFTVSVPNPGKGYYGFYVSLRYKNPNGNGNFLVSTRTFIIDKSGIVE